MASLFGEDIPVAELLRQEGSMLASGRVDARASGTYFCPVPGCSRTLLATHRGLLVRLLCRSMLTYICRGSFPSDRLRNGLLPKALPLVGAVV